jgi:hypothetical protein
MRAAFPFSVHRYPQCTDIDGHTAFQREIEQLFCARTAALSELRHLPAREAGGATPADSGAGPRGSAPPRQRWVQALHRRGLNMCPAIVDW